MLSRMKEWADRMLAGGEDSGDLGVFGATSNEVCRERAESGREVFKVRAVCNWLADAELREFKETVYSWRNLGA